MKKNVIIAEDNNAIQTLLNRILTQLHYNTKSAKNGEEVIEILQNNSIDLILMDIYMPLMDGITCARNIRKMNGEKSKVPIIAITGNNQNYSEEDFKKEGIDVFLPKPIQFDMLIHQIKSILGDH